jgi:hypothetical protein
VKNTVPRLRTLQRQDSPVHLVPPVQGPLKPANPVADCSHRPATPAHFSSATGGGSREPGVGRARCISICNHKTFILLHAGDHVVLNELANFFATEENPYPWVKFSEPGLNDAITSVAIVISERLYDEASTAAGRAPIGTESSAVAVGDYSAWEIEFLKRRVVCALAQ